MKIGLVGRLCFGVACLTALSGAALSETKLDPAMLVTAAEAKALLGGDATLEVFNMQGAYPGSVDFAYQTKNIRILTVQIIPGNAAEMLANMRRDLGAAHPNTKQSPCSAGDACFMDRETLFATKGKWYLHLEAGRENTGKMEDLARRIMTRLP